jgi:cutinase
LCHGADPICNPADPNTWEDNWPAHLAGAYIDAGMANQAADFVAGRL